MQHFLTTIRPPCIHPNTSPPLLFLQTQPSLFALQKRAGIQETTTKHYQKGYNKARQKLSHQGWTDNPTEQTVPRAEKRVRDTPSLTVRSPTETSS